MQLIQDPKVAEMIVLPFWEGKKGAESASSCSSFDDLVKVALQGGDFKGKEGDSLLLYSAQPKREKRVLLIGLGEKSKASLETCRKGYAKAVKVALEKKLSSVNFSVPEKGGFEEGIGEGIFLANYAFDRMKKEKTQLISQIGILGVGAKQFSRFKERLSVCSAVHFARDLVNGNADEVTPQALAEHAKSLQKEFPKIQTTVFGKKEIEKHQMGLLLAVNRGAAQDPAFIILEYKGNPGSKEKTALVGKGITYDTGGLNLKPTGSMETMKCDMSGAAVVLGTLRAAASIGLKVNLVGVIPSAENAIGPEAYKPGDVYRSYLGTTVEISNTDAEGRLVLADALAYTEKNLNPTRIIDLATLTGSIVVALGEEVAGLFSNNDLLAEALHSAGQETFERVWRMPLYAEYKQELKSKIADLKNSGSRKAGSISAALFLQEFVKDTPWAHLDIAGTAFLSECKSYQPTYATGMGVRLLIHFLAHGK